MLQHTLRLKLTIRNKPLSQEPQELSSLILDWGSWLAEHFCHVWGCKHAFTQIGLPKLSKRNKLQGPGSTKFVCRGRNSVEPGSQQLEGLDLCQNLKSLRLDSKTLKGPSAAVGPSQAISLSLSTFTRPLRSSQNVNHWFSGSFEPRSINSWQ